ncbi:hypothetical protein ILYODFUR_013185 [Ilyodon furcidens]|uniref:Uncharacterized protein n=1 Tax=Ilyodon furcidens TaxID=33524 RepID=A0ABV0UUE0_9TELE
MAWFITSYLMHALQDLMFPLKVTCLCFYLLVFRCKSVDMDSHLQSGQDNASPALASPHSFKRASFEHYLDTVQRELLFYRLLIGVRVVLLSTQSEHNTALMGIMRNCSMCLNLPCLAREDDLFSCTNSMFLPLLPV